MGRPPFANKAKLLWRLRFVLIISPLLALGAFFYSTGTPEVPDWFRYDPAHPYAIFDAWKHLTTRRAEIGLYSDWNVIGGILTDDWNRPLAHTPIHFVLSTRHSMGVDLITDANGRFLVYGTYGQEMDPPYQPPGLWDRLIARLPARLSSLFSRKTPTGIIIRVDSTHLYACPGYPDTPTARAFAASKKELRDCSPELLLKETNRVFYHFTVKRQNTFTPAGLAAFLKNSTTNIPTRPLNIWGSAPRPREGPTEGRARNLYQIRILDPEGRPTAKASVIFTSYDGFVDNRQVVETDQNGNAELEEWLLAGKALEPFGKNYHSERSLQIDADLLPFGPIKYVLNTNVVNVIKLPIAASIAGKTSGENGEPLVGTLRLYYPRDRLSYEGDIHIRPDGSFSCGQIMPGEPIRLAGGFNNEAPIDITLNPLSPGESRSNILIQSCQAAALRGILIDTNGDPVNAWNISLEIEGHPKMYAEGPRFGFAGIGPAPFRIRVNAKDHLEYLSDSMRLEPGELRFVKLVTQINPGKFVVKPLRAWLEDIEHSGGEPREWAETSIRKMGTNALPELLTMISSPDALTRGLAVRGFETLSNSAAPAVPALANIAQDTSPNKAEVRDWAIDALVGIKDKAATPPLIKLLEGDENVRVKNTAIWALGRLNYEPEVVVPLITKILADGREEYRVSCLYALGDFGSNSRPALPLVLKALEDKSDFTRRYASNALIGIDPQFAKGHGVQ